MALDIRKLVASDGGEYVCHAFNALGKSKSAVSLQVAAKGSLDLSSQLHEGLDKIKALESPAKATREEKLTTFLKPVFTTTLQNVVMSENQSAHLATRLVLVGDALLKFEWYKEGKLLETGGIIINLCCFPKFFLLVLICPNV